MSFHCLETYPQKWQELPTVLYHAQNRAEMISWTAWSWTRVSKKVKVFLHDEDTPKSLGRAQFSCSDTNPALVSCIFLCEEWQALPSRHFIGRKARESFQYLQQRAHIVVCDNMLYCPTCRLIMCATVTFAGIRGACCGNCITFLHRTAKSVARAVNCTNCRSQSLLRLLHHYWVHLKSLHMMGNGTEKETLRTLRIAHFFLRQYHLQKYFRTLVVVVNVCGTGNIHHSHPWIFRTLLAQKKAGNIFRILRGDFSRKKYFFSFGMVL